jgi:ABC-type phosphate transport system substrate-binding protein
MRNIMTTISKVALALAGVVGLALSAESAHAQLVLNGIGSSSGRQFAGLSPAAICDASPLPILYVSSETIPEKYEWQCTVTVNGRAYPNSRIRYSGNRSISAYQYQNIFSLSTPYLDTTMPGFCPSPPNTAVLILNKAVRKAVCPANTPTQSLPVHWGGSGDKASSFHQFRGVGDGVTPPTDGHLTTTEVAIVPYAIVLGAGVKNIVSGRPLSSLTEHQIRQIMTGNVTTWEGLGYQGFPANAPIFLCQRTAGSGALAALDEIIGRPKFWVSSNYPGRGNPDTTTMIACINDHPNSIGYLDSDSVTPATFPSGGPYQIQIGGEPVNDGVLGTGKDRLTALRCGRYPYWTTWNFITRTAGVETSPFPPFGGTPGDLNAAITALGAAMQVNNPLPDYWVSLDDMFVFKNVDRGPHFWNLTIGTFNGTFNNEPISPTCN